MPGNSILRLPELGDLQLGLQPLGYSFPDQVVAGDPEEVGHIFHDRQISQATIGIWESKAGTVSFDAYPFDELCILVEGNLALVGSDGAAETFRAGDVFLIRKGWAGLWIMHAPIKKYYVELKD